MRKRIPFAFRENEGNLQALAKNIQQIIPKI